jgi:hypothetical protein
MSERFQKSVMYTGENMSQSENIGFRNVRLSEYCQMYSEINVGLLNNIDERLLKIVYGQEFPRQAYSYQGYPNCSDSCHSSSAFDRQPL